jgi:tripartite-type tricarboxylate transporter receptor subunit TctC
MLRGRWPIMVVMFGFLLGPPAKADVAAVQNFYANHQIKIIIRSSPGGTYDFYSRMFAQFMGAHIPGHPTIIPINMPGAGGMTAANYVGREAPHDGTILTIIGLGLPLLQAIGGGESLHTELKQFGWLGSVSNSNQVTVAWHTSKVLTLAEAQRQVSLTGVPGVGAPSQQLISFYNYFLGTKFKPVYGYQTSVDINVAMERGEVDGAGSNAWEEYLISAPDQVRDKKIVPLIQTGLEKEPTLPDTPLLLDLAKTPEQQAAFRMMSESISLGRALAASPDVPPERLEALRTAFTQTISDPQFIAAVEKGRGSVRPKTAEQVEAIIQSLFDAPAPVRALVKAGQAP